MSFWRAIATLCTLCFLALGVAPVALAQTAGEAQDQAEASDALRPKPDLSDVDAIRFLTDNDYPPFNYLDEEGALTGFNVDLARALCDELVVECDVRAVDWGQLVTALESGETDAVVASIRTSKGALVNLDFTDPYYNTPARFVALKETVLASTTPDALTGRKIAVVAATAHEVFLKDFYEGAEIIAFPDLGKAKDALLLGNADMLFGDGISLMFWLNGTASQNCCEFRGGAYADSRYFGEGVGIALRRGNRKMRNILNYGLERLRLNGRLEELYLRYFPLSFF